VFSVAHMVLLDRHMPHLLEDMIQDIQVAEKVGSRAESVGSQPEDRPQALSLLDSRQPWCSEDSPFEVPPEGRFHVRWLVDSRPELTGSRLAALSDNRDVQQVEMVDTGPANAKNTRQHYTYTHTQTHHHHHQQ